MELRQLRCFLVVAETLHFGRAAQQLGMLPASLGRQIKQLEEGLGVRLLTRTTRNVTLTAAGAALVEAAQDLVERAERLEMQLRERHRETMSILRVGAIDSAAAGLIPQLLPHFRERYPDIEVQLLEQKTVRLLPKLLSGRLDVAFVRPPQMLNPRLVCQPLFYETAVVAVPDGHRLARKRRISIAEMAEEPLIVPDRRSRPHSHDLSIKLFLQSGLYPRIAQIADEKQTILSLVASGIGLAIVPKWASKMAVGGVRFLPIKVADGIARATLALSAVWLRDTRDPVRDKFLEVLHDHLSEYAATA